MIRSWIYYEKENQKQTYDKNLFFKNTIKLKEVSFKYGGKKINALNEISIEIKKFSNIGIVGKSGSGKSTLIDIISGLIENYVQLRNGDSLLFLQS